MASQPSRPKSASVADQSGLASTITAIKAREATTNTDAKKPAFSITVLDRIDYDLLSAAKQALDDHRGYTTPLEKFVYNMLMRLSYFTRSMTPADVLEILEEFQMDFDDAIGITKRFCRDYSEVLLATEKEIANDK